jgi:large subunit ribosomal protein L4
MYQGAMRSMLSELVRQDRLRVTEHITLEAGKTRLLVNQLKTWELDDVLIVVEAVEEKLFLAARNLHKVQVLEVGKLNPVALVSHDKVLMTVAAVKMLEERLP